MTFRRLSAVALLIGGVTASISPAFAQQEEGPSIDVVEVSGVIDAPIHRYLIERIDDAEARNVSLLVFQVDSLGMLKVPLGESGLPLIVERVRDATVPVAVHLGPRGAHASGGVVALLAAAHIASAGPSSIIDLRWGFDLAEPVNRDDPATDPTVAGAVMAEWIELSQIRGRFPSGSTDPVPILPPEVRSAGSALEIGFIDQVVPSVADLLLAVHGTTVSVAGTDVTLDVPKDLSTVRFWQPGPIRRVLHALAVPPLAYLLLCFGLILLVFESSQPGFGVAGGTAVLLLGGAAYAFTVLPARWYGLALLLFGNLLLWIDVIRDELKLPTWLGLAAFGTGSFLLLPRGNAATTLPTWVALATTFGAFIFFGPIMTLVHRARRPIATGVKRKLIGEAGDVRSMLNPEGYVMVDGELWRARLEGAAKRLRVGERVTVTGVDGAVLLVTGTDTSAN